MTATPSHPVSATPPVASITYPELAGPELVTFMEKIISDAYKREFDQEENVWRTLPLFATAISLIVGLGTLLNTALTPFGFGWFPLVTCGALIGMYGALLFVIYFLYEATQRRQVKHPTEEHLLIEKAAEFENYYRLGGAAPEEVDKLATLGMLQVMARQFSVSARSSRRNNLVRYSARARATHALGVALLFVFLLTGAIFVRDGVKELADGNAFAPRAGDATEGQTDGSVRPTTPKAGGSRDDGHSDRGMDILHQGSGRPTDDGDTRMNEKTPESPTSAPVSPNATSAAPSAAPVMGRSLPRPSDPPMMEIMKAHQPPPREDR